MSEPTRVPLQPIRKGSLGKVWAGIVAVLIVAIVAAWLTVPRGVKVEELVAGSGAHPGKDDVVFIDYVGKLPDGTVFDQSHPMNLPIPGILPDGTPMLVKESVPGFSEALQKMQKGGKYEVTIPADKAYGATPPAGSPIPPNSDLIFEVTMHDFMPESEAQQRVQVLQQMMQQQQQGKGGAPGAPAPQPGQ